MFAAAGALHAQTYPIRLAPAVHPGDKYSISTTGSQLQQHAIIKDGRAGQNQIAEYEVVFEGRVAPTR